MGANSMIEEMTDIGEVAKVESDDEACGGILK